MRRPYTVALSAAHSAAVGQQGSVGVQNPAARADGEARASASRARVAGDAGGSASARGGRCSDARRACAATTTKRKQRFVNIRKNVERYG